MRLTDFDPNAGPGIFVDAVYGALPDGESAKDEESDGGLYFWHMEKGLYREIWGSPNAGGKVDERTWEI